MKGLLSTKASKMLFSNARRLLRRLQSVIPKKRKIKSSQNDLRSEENGNILN